MAVDVSSEPVFLSTKRRISMDVSSGLIFLTKNKQTNKTKTCQNQFLAEFWKLIKGSQQTDEAYSLMKTTHNNQIVEGQK